MAIASGKIYGNIPGEWTWGDITDCRKMQKKKKVRNYKMVCALVVLQLINS